MWKIAVALVGLAWVACLASMPREAFWISDDGNRYIQLRNFDASHELDIQYRAADVDPEIRYFPMCGHHFQPVGDRVYSFYPFFFSLISLGPFKLLGVWGIYVIPLFAAVGCLLVLRPLLRELGVPDLRGLEIVAFGLCTPLWFYALVFWEHSLAILLAMAGVLLVLRGARTEEFAWKLLAGGGLLLGLSTLLREEGYVLTAVVLVAFVLTWRAKWKRALPVLGGWLCVVIPLWIANQSLFGHPLGLHAAVYSQLPVAPHPDTSWLAERAQRFGVYLFKFHPDPRTAIGWGVCLGAALVMGFVPRTGPRLAQARLALLGVGLLGAIALAVPLWTDPNPVFNTLVRQALFPCVPFLLLAGCGLGGWLDRRTPEMKFAALVFLLGIVATCLSLNTADMGIIWGPRHFLALLPFGLALALKEAASLEVASPKIARAVVAGLFLVAFANQAQGFVLLREKKIATADLLTELRRTPDEAIVTDTYWLPEEVAALYQDRRILAVQSPQDLEVVASLLGAGGAKGFTLALSPGYSRIPLDDLALFVDVADTKLMRHEKVSFMNVYLVHCRIRGRK